VCEEGACVAPPPEAASDASPVGGPVAGAAPPSTPTTNNGAVAGPALVPPLAEPPPQASDDPRQPLAGPAMRRHSTGMMAGGIVMVSFVPIALLAAWVADLEQSDCEGNGLFSIDGSESRNTGVDCGRFDATIYGGLATAAVLAGVGIPMIVIGGKKEPAGFARVTPWATPHAAGLGLRLDL